MTNYKEQLTSIIQNEKWLMELLQTVKSLNLPEWYIAAGAIRNTMWDVLHHYKHRTPLKDVDIIFYDLKDINSNKKTEKEKWAEEKLTRLRPNLKWEVVNQARVHLFKKKINLCRKQPTSCKDSMRYWSEISNCIGVKLNTNNSLQICAPYGLEDLMTLNVRPTPNPFSRPHLYKNRISTKGWQETWPRLKIQKID